MNVLSEINDSYKDFIKVPNGRYLLETAAVGTSFELDEVKGIKRGEVIRQFWESHLSYISTAMQQFFSGIRTFNSFLLEESVKIIETRENYFNEVIKLEFEPNNPFDDHAIAVECVWKENKFYKVGYIPAKYSEVISCSKFSNMFLIGVKGTFNKRNIILTIAFMGDDDTIAKTPVKDRIKNSPLEVINSEFMTLRKIRNLLEGE